MEYGPASGFQARGLTLRAQAHQTTGRLGWRVARLLDRLRWGRKTAHEMTANHLGTRGAVLLSCNPMIQ